VFAGNNFFLNPFLNLRRILNYRESEIRSNTLLMLFFFINFSLELFVLRLRFKPTFLNTLVFPSELRRRVFDYRVLRDLFGP